MMDFCTDIFELSRKQLHFILFYCDKDRKEAEKLLESLHYVDLRGCLYDNPSYSPVDKSDNNPPYETKVDNKDEQTGIDNPDVNLPDKTCIDTSEVNLRDKTCIDTLEVNLRDKTCIDTLEVNLRDKTCIDTLEVNLRDKTCIDTSEVNLRDKTCIDTSEVNLRDKTCIDTSDVKLPNPTLIDTSDVNLRDKTCIDTSDVKLPNPTLIDTSDVNLRDKTCIDTPDVNLSDQMLLHKDGKQDACLGAIYKFILVTKNLLSDPSSVKWKDDKMLTGSTADVLPVFAVSRKDVPEMGPLSFLKTLPGLNVHDSSKYFLRMFQHKSIVVKKQEWCRKRLNHLVGLLSTVRTFSRLKGSSPTCSIQETEMDTSQSQKEGGKRETREGGQHPTRNRMEPHLTRNRRGQLPTRNRRGQLPSKNRKGQHPFEIKGSNIQLETEWDNTQSKTDAGPSKLGTKQKTKPTEQLDKTSSDAHSLEQTSAGTPDAKDQQKYVMTQDGNIDLSKEGLTDDTVQQKVMSKHTKDCRNLDLSNNFLTQLFNFNRHLSGISHLNLSGNKISEVDWSVIPIITEVLDLSNNEIEELFMPNNESPSHLGNLTTLRLGNNRITSFDVTIRSVTQLDLSHNDIESINVEKYTKLKELKLNHNKITCFGPFPTALTSLDVSDNKIDNAGEPISLLQLKELKYLRLNNNMIESLANVPEGLELLHLHDNYKLYHLGPQQNLKNIEEMTLCNTYIRATHEASCVHGQKCVPQSEVHLEAVLEDMVKNARARLDIMMEMEREPFYHEYTTTKQIKKRLDRKLPAAEGSGYYRLHNSRAEQDGIEAHINEESVLDPESLNSLNIISHAVNPEDAQFIEWGKPVTCIYEFLPHRFTFSGPVYIRFRLKMKGEYDVNSLRVLYSDTNTDESPVWIDLRESESEQYKGIRWLMLDGWCYMAMNHFCKVIVIEGVKVVPVWALLYANYDANVKQASVMVTYTCGCDSGHILKKVKKEYGVNYGEPIHKQSILMRGNAGCLQTRLQTNKFCQNWEILNTSATTKVDKDLLLYFCEADILPPHSVYHLYHTGEIDNRGIIQIILQQQPEGECVNTYQQELCWWLHQKVQSPRVEYPRYSFLGNVIQNTWSIVSYGFGATKSFLRSTLTKKANERNQVEEARCLNPPNRTVGSTSLTQQNQKSGSTTLNEQNQMTGILNQQNQIEGAAVPLLDAQNQMAEAPCLNGVFHSNKNNNSKTSYPDIPQLYGNDHLQISTDSEGLFDHEDNTCSSDWIEIDYESVIADNRSCGDSNTQANPEFDMMNTNIELTSTDENNMLHAKNGFRCNSPPSFGTSTKVPVNCTPTKVPVNCTPTKVPVNCTPTKVPNNCTGKKCQLSAGMKSNVSNNGDCFGNHFQPSVRMPTNMSIDGKCVRNKCQPSNQIPNELPHDGDCFGSNCDPLIKIPANVSDEAKYIGNDHFRRNCGQQVDIPANVSNEAKYIGNDHFGSNRDPQIPANVSNDGQCGGNNHFRSNCDPQTDTQANVSNEAKCIGNDHIRRNCDPQTDTQANVSNEAKCIGNDHIRRNCGPQTDTQANVSNEAKCIGNDHIRRNCGPQTDTQANVSNDGQCGGNDHFRSNCDPQTDIAANDRNCIANNCQSSLVTSTNDVNFDEPTCRVKDGCVRPRTNDVPLNHSTNQNFSLLPYTDMSLKDANFFLNEKPTLNKLLLQDNRHIHINYIMVSDPAVANQSSLSIEYEKWPKGAGQSFRMYLEPFVQALDNTSNEDKRQKVARTMGVKNLDNVDADFLLHTWFMAQKENFGGQYDKKMWVPQFWETLQQVNAQNEAKLLILAIEKQILHDKLQLFIEKLKQLDVFVVAFWVQSLITNEEHDDLLSNQKHVSKRIQYFLQKVVLKGEKEEFELFKKHLDETGHSFLLDMITIKTEIKST